MTFLQLIWLHMHLFTMIGSAFAVFAIVDTLLRDHLRRELLRRQSSRAARATTVSRTTPSAQYDKLSVCAQTVPELTGRTAQISNFCAFIFQTSPQCLLGMMMVAGMASTTHAGQNWTTFQNGGEVSLAAAEPKHGNQALALKWKSEIPGYGQSSPVTWNQQIFITSVSGENKETYHISAFRLSDGKREWQYDLKNSSPQESSNYVSKAAPTPAVDDRGLICFFEGGNVVALTHTGDVRWERDLVKDYGAIDARHGLAASVEQLDDAAFIWVERQTDPYVIAVDKQTGKTLWKVAGLGTTSWSSPRLIPTSQGPHLVLSGVGTIVGLNPKNGEPLWKMEGISGNSTPTPIPMGDGRFLIGATVGRGESSGGAAAESNGVIAIRQQDDNSWKADYAWQARRATSSFGSPIWHGDNVYFVNRSGVLYRLDAKTGEEKLARRIGGSVWATPLAIGDRLFLFGQKGLIQVFSTDPELKQLDELELFTTTQTQQETNAPPAGKTLYAAVSSDNVFLVRTGDELYCIHHPQSPVGKPGTN